MRCVSASALGFGSFACGSPPGCTLFGGLSALVLRYVPLVWLKGPSHCPPAWVFLVVVSLGFTLCGFLGGGFGSSPGGLLLLQPFTSPLPLLHVVSLVYLASAPVPPSLLPTNMWLPHSPSSALVSSSWLIVSFSTAGGFSVT